MLLWHLAFVCLCLASVAGMVLFFGFTFRVRIAYPLSVVTTHLILAIATSVLFSAAVIHRFTNGKPLSVLYVVLLIVSVAIVLVTLIVGIIYFIRFNLKQKDGHGHFIGMHVTMAAVSFIFITASTIAITQTVSMKNVVAHPSLYNFYKHHHNAPGRFKQH